MHRSTLALACALALTLAAAPEAQALARPAASISAADRGATALERLRDDARATMSVRRDGDGGVAVSSSDGRAILAGGSGSPAAVTSRVLGRYGAAFGLDGRRSRAEVEQTVTSLTGGHVVRAQQVVDGVPVYAGQVVTSLDSHGGVLAVDADTTPLDAVPAARITEQRAAGVAVATVAKHAHVPARSLSVRRDGRVVYDPDLLHVTDPGGARPAWSFLVGDGGETSRRVLVGTDRGEVVLEADELDRFARRVCDAAGSSTVSLGDDVPDCVAPARGEGGPATGTQDVDAAYDNLGAVSATYASAGVDLTQLVGPVPTGGGTRSLSATVRWCFADECPVTDAFWDGRQVVIGAGWARADDVLGHELTHAFIEKTAQFAPLDQSAAVGESIADVLGEVVDHANPLSAADDSAWTVGEDLPAGSPTFSLKDPTSSGQPDRVTSDKLVLSDDLDPDAAHVNAGIGNKTAYLISQGGTFNGRTMTGIDGADASLARTARLYVETTKRLTSGAEYADLGRVLASTCDQLVAAKVAGFAAATCASVRTAVAATELESPVPGANPDTALVCPNHGTPSVNLVDDDTHDDFRLTQSTSPLWSKNSPDAPRYASEGTGSWFGIDPDPSLGDPASGSITTNTLALWVPETSADNLGTFLSFRHAYYFEHDEDTAYDGGEVIITDALSSQRVEDQLDWQNGPDVDVVGGGGFVGFGGQSHGYGTSIVDLTPLAGRQIFLEFRVAGDDDIGFLGWWLDDIRMSTCHRTMPSAPSAVRVVTTSTGATVSWSPPADPGSGFVRWYYSSSSSSGPLPLATRQLTLRRPAYGPTWVDVFAMTSDGALGAPAHVVIRNVTATLGSSVTRVRRNRAFSLIGYVVPRDNGGVRGIPVWLQAYTSTGWRTIATGTTGSDGRKVWMWRQARTTSYRFVVPATSGTFLTVSPTRVVRRR